MSNNWQQGNQAQQTWEPRENNIQGRVKMSSNWQQTRADLRPDLRGLLTEYKDGKAFSRKEGDAAVAALSQGETDVLTQVAEILGWKSLESLAVKYFPKFPNRKWWMEAKRRVLKYSNLRNITYFLLCLMSIEKEHLEAAFNGRVALNRLVHSTKKVINEGSNRLVGATGVNGVIDFGGGKSPPPLARVGGAAF